MIPSAQTVIEWLPELAWNRAEACRILAQLTVNGADPPRLQSERRRELSEATR